MWHMHGNRQREWQRRIWLVRCRGVGIAQPRNGNARSARGSHGNSKACTSAHRNAIAYIDNHAVTRAHLHTATTPADGNPTPADGKPHARRCRPQHLPV